MPTTEIQMEAGLLQVKVAETEQELNFLAFKLCVALFLEGLCEFGFGRR